MPRFTQNEDGTITDNETGLTWTKETLAKDVTYEDALKVLGEGWRLPTMLVSWNKRHKPKPGWHYPKNNADTANMPEPGQKVILFYDLEGEPQGPVVCTPIHADGSHLIDGKSIYCRCVRWIEIPSE